MAEQRPEHFDDSHRHRHDRTRVGWRARAQHAAAALVAVDVLRHHRLVDRLLDRLSVVAAAVRLHARACSAGNRATRSSTSWRACRRSAGRWPTSSPTLRCSEIVNDEQLLAFARAQARPIFNENCAACHGSGGGGAKGYPNLNDDEWLWGGKLDDIVTTIRHGIRSTDDKTPAWQHAGVRPRRHDEARRYRDRRRLRAFDRRTAGRAEGRSGGGQEDFRRQLRLLSRRRPARASATWARPI